MDTVETQIGRIAQDVWLSMLGVEIQPAPSHAAIDASVRSLSGCVHMSGAWEGSVVISCVAELAHQATEAMFGLDEGAASSEEIHDTIGELANMIGGNVKALMPAPSQLSLPSVSEGTGLEMSIPGARSLTQLALESDGKLLFIELHQKK